MVTGFQNCAPGEGFWLKQITILKLLIIVPALISLSACSLTSLASKKSSSGDELFAKSAFVTPKSGRQLAREGEEAVMAGAEKALAEAETALAASADLINPGACAEGLQGQLMTALAGEDFLQANGLQGSGEGFSANVVRPVRPMVDMAAVAPAPSAGTAESSSSLWGFLSGKSGMTQSLLMSAYEQTGRPYKAGGRSPSAGFDAAGFTRWVYAQKGVDLPNDALRQAQSGRQVTREQLRPGDLLVYKDPSGEGCHVGIYTGQGNFLHAAAKTGVVTETAAFGPQYSPYFIGGRRYFDDPKASPLTDSQKMAAASRAVKLALSELGPNDKLERPKITPKRSKGKAKAKAKTTAKKNKS